MKRKALHNVSRIKIGDEKMYFYTLSNGVYSDYSNTTIYHKKKFTKKQFVEMYNQTLKSMGGEYNYHDEIAEEMVEKFGFKIVKDEFEIGVGYGSHKPIDINENIRG